MGLVATIITELATQAHETEILTIDATHAKARRTALKAGALLADRGYVAEWFRNTLIEMGISLGTPPRVGRKVPTPHVA